MIVSREIIAGLTYLDIISCAGMNHRQAAIRLGVNEGHFRKTMKRLGASHWFPDVRPRPRCISAEDIARLAAEGYTKKDAAYIAGVSFGYFKELVKEYHMGHLFPSTGKASWISRRGYCT